MHVICFEDQTHMSTHIQTCTAGVFNKKPTCELTCILPSLGASGYGQCGKRRGSWGSSGPGAGLLKGSCNFHSRVLLKLVLRSLPCPNTNLPSHPVHPSHPRFLALGSAATSRQLPVPVQSMSFTSVLCSAGWRSVYVHVWALIFLTICTQTKICWLLKNIDYRCGYGVYFFYS